ncbi:hypothetical protein [Paraburkholderia sp. MM6662-R1]|uniref:hypothetical protein n=1 Tax=Paraburkholderia sp. MM6662-R1 TaxID=2991066 RepID=UPI003D1B5CED
MVSDALRRATLAQTDREALDITGAALARLAELAHERYSLEADRLNIQPMPAGGALAAVAALSREEVRHA